MRFSSSLRSSPSGCRMSEHIGLRVEAENTGRSRYRKLAEECYSRLPWRSGYARRRAKAG